MTAIGDDDFLSGLATLVADSLDLLDDVHALNDGAENDVTVVQPGSLDSCHEELRTICVWASVSLCNRIEYIVL